MENNQQHPDNESGDNESGADRPEEPTTEELQEPSTEKDPGEEPKAPARDEAEPDHEAVGIGVVGRPQSEAEEDASASDE